MAFRELGTHRAFQPWRAAGLAMWLCDDEAHLQAVRDARKQGAALSGKVAVAAATVNPAAAPAIAPAPASTSAVASFARNPAFRPQAVAPEAVVQTGAAATSAVPSFTTSAAPPFTTTATPSCPEAACTACIREQQDWPDSWRELLKRSPQPVAGRRARIVWSYPALSDDYGGRANPARRAMLQQLLRDLSLPAGSHGFWPLTPPPYEMPAAEPDPVFFHSGIAALNPSVVVLFGNVSPQLCLPTMVQLVPEMVLGRSFVRVQDIDALAQPFVTSSAGAHLPHAALVQFLRSQFGALFIG